MKVLFRSILASLLLVWSISFGQGPDQSEDLTGTISYLLSYVEKSDCIFIRNNREHTAQQAAHHMQRKYDHFKSEIKTPEDFIRLTATKSLISGKPYRVKLKTGELIASETWLLKALEVYRQTRANK
jgi:hypothetical protein